VRKPGRCHGCPVIAWDQRWPQLRIGEVFPLPLATETNWMATWEVNVIMLTDVSPSGYSHVTLWTYTEPYEDDDASPEAAAAVTDRAITQFALRLKALLAMPVDSSPDSERVASAPTRPS